MNIANVSMNFNLTMDLMQGHEYDFYQNWGEQLENCYNSLVVVLNLDSDGFQYYTLPNNDFPCDLQWVGNSSFIGLSLVDSPWRLGSIYCANRESKVFQMDEHGHRKINFYEVVHHKHFCRTQ